MRAVPALVATGTQPAAAKRIAFVAGIDRYDNLKIDQQLEKAVNDAGAVGGALEGLDFTVFTHLNLGRIEFVRAWSRFLAVIEPGDTVAVFFAGHGVEIDGANFLVSRDVPVVGDGEEGVLKAASLRMATLMEELRNRSPQVSLVILDACRDNPFITSAGRSLGTSRGLARVNPPRGTFVMFSADAGERALDRLPGNDPDPNSVYTRNLVPLLSKPGLGLRDIAVRVRGEVNALARSVGLEQFPAYYDAMTAELYLAGQFGGEPGETTAAPPAPVRPVRPVDPAAQAFEAVRGSNRAADLEAFIEAFPDSFYARLAATRLEELAETEVAVGVFPADEPKSEPVQGLEPGDEFQDCDACPKMVVVPAGSFTMGSPPGEAERYGDEGPQHKVTIAEPFAVGRFEVTFAEWDGCVADGGCSGYRPADKSWGRGLRPVINVSWDDARAYVAWLSRKTGGRPYRLPSEAEWEYAARAGTTTPFSTGLTITADQANFHGNFTYNDSRTGRYRDQTVAVGSFRANAFGLHDMHGNVREWAEDFWSNSYAGAPSNGSPWTTGDCGLHMVRGGSWIDFPWNLRSAIRSGDYTGLRINFIGFRVARTLIP